MTNPLMAVFDGVGLAGSIKRRQAKNRETGK